MVIIYLINQNRALKDRITDIKKMLQICFMTDIIEDDIKINSFDY